MSITNILVPSNMLNFQCAQCGQCCKGWTVYVDKTSLTALQKAFQKEKIETGLLRRNFKRTPGKTDEYNYATVRMLNKQCGFLGEQNSCALHSQFGPSYLPVVCRLFPRKIIATPRGLEFSYSFSCPEAVRHLATDQPTKLLLNPDGFSFAQSHQYYGELSHHLFQQSPVRKKYFVLEEIFLHLLQDRRYTLQERLIFWGLLISSLQSACLSENDLAEQAQEIVSSMLETSSFYQQMQEIEPDLPYQLKALYQFLACRLEEKDDWQLAEILADSFPLLGLSEDELKIELYQELYEKYFRCHEQEVEHILENYLVNYLLGKNFFLYRLNEAFYLMIFFYKIIRYLALYLAVKREVCVNKEIILEAIHLMERGIGHNRGYYNSILRKLIKHGYISVPHAIYLLKI